MSEHGKFLMSVSLPFSVVIAVCYLSGYWWTFGIDIFSHIDASDLIMASAVPLISIGFASVIGVLIGILYAETKSEDYNDTLKGKFFSFGSIIFDVLAVTTILGTLIFGGDQKWKVIPVILTLLILSLVRQTGLLKPLIKNYTHLSYIIVFVALYLPIQAYSYGKLKALNVISGKDFQQVYLPDFDEVSGYRFVGVAGDRLFLWDTEKESYHILNLGNYQHLIINKSITNESAKPTTDKSVVSS